MSIRIFAIICIVGCILAVLDDKNQATSSRKVVSQHPGAGKVEESQSDSSTPPKSTPRNSKDDIYDASDSSSSSYPRRKSTSPEMSPDLCEEKRKSPPLSHKTSYAVFQVPEEESVHASDTSLECKEFPFIKKRIMKFSQSKETDGYKYSFRYYPKSPIHAPRWNLSEKEDPRPESEKYKYANTKRYVSLKDIGIIPSPERVREYPSTDYTLQSKENPDDPLDSNTSEAPVDVKHNEFEESSTKQHLEAITPRNTSYSPSLEDKLDPEKPVLTRSATAPTIEPSATYNGQLVENPAITRSATVPNIKLSETNDEQSTENPVIARPLPPRITLPTFSSLFRQNTFTSIREPYSTQRPPKAFTCGTPPSGSYPRIKKNYEYTNYKFSRPVASYDDVKHTTYVSNGLSTFFPMNNIRHFCHHMFKRLYTRNNLHCKHHCQRRCSSYTTKPVMCRKRSPPVHHTEVHECQIPAPSHPCSEKGSIPVPENPSITVNPGIDIPDENPPYEATEEPKKSPELIIQLPEDEVQTEKVSTKRNTPGVALSLKVVRMLIFGGIFYFLA